MIKICRTIEEPRRSEAQKRSTDFTASLVSTMGAFHAGHLALVAKAKDQANRVIAMIFLNLTRFAPDKDRDIYPR